MNKLVLFFITLIVFTSCSKRKDPLEILKINYDEYVISFDKPNLKFNLGKTEKNILILLHEKVYNEEIKKQLNLDDSTWNEKINYLFGNGLIKKKNENFIPSILIINENEGKELKHFTDSLAKEISIITLDRLLSIKEETNKVFKNYSFNDISFFILGAVANDFWQLKFYQEEFIKSFVPQRGNEKFYFALIQNSPMFEIYETNYYVYPKFDFITFSSNKFDYNIPTFPTSELTKSFGKNYQINDSLYQIKLIDELIKINEGSNYKIPIEILNGFEKFGIIKNKKSTIPVLKNKNLNQLYKIAEIIKEDLINYFETRQTMFVKKYLNSQFREEVTYKEWMIWNYKLISSKVIETLIEKQIISQTNVSPAIIIIK